VERACAQKRVPEAFKQSARQAEGQLDSANLHPKESIAVLGLTNPKLISRQMVA